MPHQCTNCGRTFADGSKEMLSGCPDCGGNKFQFRPASAVESPSAESPSASGSDAPSAADPSSGADPDGSPGGASATPSDEDPVDSAGTTAWPNTPPDAETDDSAGRDGLTDAAARAGAAVRDRFSRDDASPEPSEGDDVETGADSVEEDSAQATARSDVVSHEELSAAASDVDTEPDTTPDSGDRPDAPAADDTTAGAPNADPQSTGEDAGADRPPAGDETVADTPPADEERIAATPAEGEQPDLTELRQELNDQFESIKIVSPGQYELNLMELYDRDEYIISLQEDGRYVIEVPDRWREDE